MHSNSSDPYSIAVVIPAYNIADYIARAIDSVLAQTHPADEIIVVDDGSVDNTAKIIKNYGEKVRYIYQENAGLAAARNTGIKAATSEWMAFLDGDDEWLENHLKLQIELLQRNPELVWSTGNFNRYLCDENISRPHVSPKQALKALAGKDYFEDYFDAYMSDMGGHPNTMVIKRRMIEEAGMFRHGIAFSEDIDMWFRMAMRWPRIGYVPEPIAVYRISRPGSLQFDTQSEPKMKVICDLIERSIKLAQQHQRMQKFQPCVEFCLHRVIRTCLFQYQMAPFVRGMIDRFDDYLSPGYKMLIHLLMRFPRATANTCHAISRVVRLLKLRRRLRNPPRR